VTGEPEHPPLAAYRAAMDDALRQLAADVGVPAYLLDYGGLLALAVELNDRYAGRWHIWFVALAGEVEWLARPGGPEPVGPATLSAWSADDLVGQIEQSGGKRLWVRGIMSARADPAARYRKRANGAPSPTGDGAPFGVWRLVVRVRVRRFAARRDVDGELFVADVATAVMMALARGAGEFPRGEVPEPDRVGVPAR